jgi:hypothetical protein
LSPEAIIEAVLRKALTTEELRSVIRAAKLTSASIDFTPFIVDVKSLD